MRSSPLPYGCGFKTLDISFHSEWVMSEYDSKEHAELNEYVEDKLVEFAKRICKNYGKGEHPEELPNILHHLRRARSLGWVLGRSYMLREQALWSKEDLGYNVADDIYCYCGKGLPVDDIAPKKK